MTLIDRMTGAAGGGARGSQSLDAMADRVRHGKKELFTLFRNEEGNFCAGLFGFLQARGAVPRQTSAHSRTRCSPCRRRPSQVALLVKGSRGSSARSTRFLPRR